MTSKPFITIFIIIASALANNFQTRFESKLADVNTLLLPILDITNAEKGEDSSIETVDKLTNQILLNTAEVRPELWIDIAKNDIIYEFYFDRTWDKQNQEDLAVKRQAQKIFKQYIEIGNNEVMCRKVTKADIEQFDAKFHEKIKSFVASLTLHRGKSLLYQIMPSGKFDRQEIHKVVPNNDIVEMMLLLYPEIKPFVNCLEIHRIEGSADEEKEGFFLRLWNWFKSLFGWKPKDKITPKDLDEGKSKSKPSERLMPADGESVVAEASVFPDRHAEIRDYISQVSESEAGKLDNYRENLESLVALMSQPDRELATVFEAMLFKYLADQRYATDSNAIAFNNLVFPIYTYNLLLNCQKGTEPCKTKLLGAYKDTFEKMNSLFSQVLTYANEVPFEQYDNFQKFLFHAYGFFLEHMAQLDPNMAAQNLKLFWESLTGSTRGEDQKNIADAAHALEALMPKSPNDMGNGRSYSLAHEILNYLPEDEKLQNTDWFMLFIQFFGDLASAFRTDILKIGGVSKIGVSEPVGLNLPTNSYYSDLRELLTEYFKIEDEADQIGKFTVQFDAFLDKKYAQRDEKVVKNYPVLKVHNLWSATEEALSTAVKLTPANVEDHAVWYKQLFSDKGQAFLVQFFEAIGAKKGLNLKLTPEDGTFWEQLGEISWKDTQSLNPMLSKWLNRGTEKKADEGAKAFVQMI